MFRVTSLSDISGRITKVSVDADFVTSSTVYLPSGTLDSIRKRLPADLPKWRDASNREVSLVFDIVREEALGVGLGSVDKTTPQWTKFWEDASEAHGKAASIVGGKVGYMKAATVIKFLLFGYGAAAGIGGAIANRRIFRPTRMNKMLHIHEDVILDDEVQGEANCSALAELWRISNEHQPRINSLFIERITSPPKLMTEQSEPLLLLPDYVAGGFHARVSSANVLAESRVDYQSLRRSIERLVASGIVNDFTGTVELDYHSIFPIIGPRLVSGPV
jgi:hypothetical protein